MRQGGVQLHQEGVDSGAVVVLGKHGEHVPSLAGAHADQASGAVVVPRRVDQRLAQVALDDPEPAGERRAGGVVLFVPLEPVPTHRASRLATR
jgi:hypothetical protein